MPRFAKPAFFLSLVLSLFLSVIFPGLAFAGFGGGNGVPDDSSSNHTAPDISANSMSQSDEESDFDQAKRLLHQKQYADAIPHLVMALADKPRDTEILNDLALAKRMTGDLDSALYYYGRALAIDPDDKDLHEGVGELDLAKNDAASAAKELATLTTLCPSGCEDRETLAKAIADHGAAATGATPVAASQSAASDSTIKQP